MICDCNNHSELVVFVLNNLCLWIFYIWSSFSFFNFLISKIRGSYDGLYEYGWKIYWNVLGCVLHHGAASLWDSNELVVVCWSWPTGQWENNAGSKSTADVTVIWLLHEHVFEAGISNGRIIIFGTGTLPFFLLNSLGVKP